MAAATAVAASAKPAFARRQSAPSIDAARLHNRLERLSYYGRNGSSFAGGVSRVAYSVADLTARAWIIDELKQAEIVPRIDAAGNIYGRVGGQPNQPAILFGSHIDSVPNAGNFDGDLGSFAALEVLQAVQAAKIQTRHPLEMVVWAHEESTAFGIGTAASRIVAGDLKAGDMDKVWNGMKRSDAIRRIAGNPDQIETAVRGKGTWHAYVELHIEQGGTLDKAKVPIGIVEGIVGIHRYDVVIEGFANHAGTTPMGERQDALVAASHLTLAVREIVTSRSGRQVGTVGHLDVEPNAPNVIPGKVTLTIELRDLSAETIASLSEAIRQRAARIATETKTTIELTSLGGNPPAFTADEAQRAIERASSSLRLTSTRLPSGAGHDAQMMAQLGPMGMIFVPSVGGISHSPKERTTWEDCANGANVLLHAVLEMDRI